MHKPVLLWIDLTVGTNESDLPALLCEHFDIQISGDARALDCSFGDVTPAAIFLDYDFPDRYRLSHLTAVKQRHASIPVVMLTVQHSESLALWAFRNGAMEYLVKPVPDRELRHVVERLLAIGRLKRSQRQRWQCGSGRSMPSDVPSDVPSVRMSLQERLAPAIHYVQRHYNCRIYSVTVARLCNMSATHFSREFRRAYDLTFQEFLLRYRIAQACRQLCSPRATITDIAYAVGFSDVSYFGKVFKRYVGVSASDYLMNRGAERARTALAGFGPEILTPCREVVRQLGEAFG